MTHQPEVQALEGRDKLDRVVDVLRSYGGFPEWHEAEGSYEIRDFACVFRAAADPGGPCDWHEALLAGMLGADVHPATGDAGCADCCRYIVELPAPMMARDRGAL
jgi:predicted ArsR family transcriptional regulator